MTAPRPRPAECGTGCGTGCGRASLLLLTLLVAALTGTLLPAPGAVAAPAARSASASPAPPAASAQQPSTQQLSAQQQPSSQGPVELRIDDLAPRVVTADGPPELLISGTVTNRGTDDVSALGLRVQRGAAVTGEDDTAAALEADETDDQIRPEFTPIPGVVAPGAEVGFALRVPLRGNAPTSLGLSEPGVYPLLLNLHGREGTAGSTRIAAVRLLLGVLELPGDEPVAPRGDGAAGLTVLYPIADRPRRLPTAPGEGLLLGDDELADAFAPGGRLAGLVDALGRSAPLGSPAAGSVCLAVDADLLETAEGMSQGYGVATAEGAVPGRGADAAGRWLDSLREQAAGRCVLALPFADTDLVATSRGGLADLTTTARTSGLARTGELLGTAPLPGTTMPADGVVDERSLADLVAGGVRGLLVDGRVLADGPPAGGVARLEGPTGPGGEVTAVVLDPIARDAFASRAPSSAGAVSPAGTAAPLAAQDALGALVLRAAESIPSDTPPPVRVVAPPRDWAAGPAEAGAYLDTVDALARRGLVRPLDLARVAGETGPPAPLPSASPAGDDEVNGIVAGLAPAVVDRARVVQDRQRDLLAAAEQDRIGAPTPSDLIDPLSAAVMGAVSATRRDDAAAQDAAVGALEDQMDALASMVRVVQPSGAYSLGSDDAPLLLTVENRLPVAVRVQMLIDPTPGLTAQPLPVVTVPADGRRQFPVGVDLARSGQFVVDARAETPGGEPLGPPARLLLRSSAYGTITVWLTVSAAVVLVVLASVRVARRITAARRQRRSAPQRRRARTARRGDPVDPPTRKLQSR